MKLWILFLLRAGLSFALLMPSATTVVATQPTSGQITLAFTNTPMPSDQWHLSIRFNTYVAFDNRDLRLTLRGDNGELIDEDLLWEGDAAKLDSFVVETEMHSPPAGLYMLSARLEPSTRQVSIWYVNVTSDTVFLAQSSDWENIRNEILYDACKRGLGDVPPDAFDTLAPDLAKRWYDLYHPRGIETIKAESQSKANRDSVPAFIDVSDRVFTGPERDTIAIPGSGPPEPRVLPDSVRADPSALRAGCQGQSLCGREFIRGSPEANIVPFRVRL